MAKSYFLGDGNNNFAIYVGGANTSTYLALIMISETTRISDIFKEKK